ncbi:uncharacterized protein Tco025E_04840 [Trypanosoma conorhini]|uniref:Uncharacterized protein n=1 Tax=Trypanosoma conorhini TaxID=83891 RepID=A0A3R7P4V4_9TRYP|nr:uncharacterized protein Tco025E_04840 [Trypanosoma conorhini]RNF17423.1 hypothetical protein Tco025E_04840 [Trypanosoma conorhini]
MPLAKQKGSLPRAFAELNAHFLPSRGDILTSATITVEFAPLSSPAPPDGATAEAGDTGNCDTALLLTLSHLHEIGEARVWLERKGEASGEGVGEWRQLQLSTSTLYEAKRRVVRSVDGKKPAASSSALASVELTNPVALEPKITRVGEEEENKQGKEDDEGDDGVLELVFGSSDDENNNTPGNGDDNDAGSGEASKHPKENAEAGDIYAVPSGEGGEGSNYDEDDNTGTQFVLRLWPSAASGARATDEGGWFTSRCCIEVRLLPPPRLASLSYPRLTVSSLVGKTHPEQQGVRGFDNESYLLLMGQRFYDYFICPRVAYAEGGPDAAAFTAVDVYVTAVRPFPGAVDAPWEVLHMCPFPILPEDLLCAFVKPQERDDTCPVAEEKHAGVRWRVRHHPAYTLLSSGEEDDVSVASRLYFFHCDHALCDCLLPLMRLAEEAWEETSLRAAVCVAAEHRRSPSTWVVTGCSNALLSLRRGTLCTRGAVVLVAEVLQTMRKPVPSLSSPLQVNVLRAKASVLSSALEALWRRSAGNGAVPEFAVALSSPALTRGWALCLLCNEFGWTELLSQERRIASVTISALSHGNPWWLPQRYAQETHETLLFLSSTFVVASLRHRRRYPWQLIEQRSSDAPPIEMLGESSITVSSGMHLFLVQRLLLQQQQCRVGGGDATSLPVVFQASLYYEEDQKHDACRDVNLRLTCANNNITHRLRMGGIQCTSSMWSLDVPFTVVFFALEGASRSWLPPAGARNEKKLRCRATHVLHCCWRVSGLAWARGLDQHTSFSLLGMETEEDGKDAPTKKEKLDKEDEERGENVEPFSMRIPVLTLNPKLVPAALSICVQHSWFWSRFASPLEALALQVMLQHIIKQALGEGENHVEESDLVFTPLMNQLLEGILEDRCRLSCKAGETSPAELFLGALRAVDPGAASVQVRIYPSLCTRFVQLVSKLNSSAPVALGSAVKRERNADEVPSLPEGLNGVRARMLKLLRTVEAYDALLPRTRPRRRQRHELQEGGEEQRQPQRPRLLLSLRRRPALHQPQEKGHEEVKLGKATDMMSAHNPSDVASMIGRVITKGAEAGVTDGTLLAARSAALSLVMPLWLLLHDRPGISEARKTALLEGAEDIYESLRGDSAAAELDAVLFRGYESLLPKREPAVRRRDGAGNF